MINKFQHFYGSNLIRKAQLILWFQIVSACSQSLSKNSWKDLKVVSRILMDNYLSIVAIWVCSSLLGILHIFRSKDTFLSISQRQKSQVLSSGGCAATRVIGNWNHRSWECDVGHVSDHFLPTQFRSNFLPKSVLTATSLCVVLHQAQYIKD